MHNQIFFTNILRLLEEWGMTKKDLADKTGISISFLSDLTNGKANPSLKVMESIAKAFNVPVSVLLEMNDLDTDTLEELTGGSKITSLPSGFVRIASAVLTKYQAFTVMKWDEKNKALLSKTKKRKHQTITDIP